MNAIALAKITKLTNFTGGDRQVFIEKILDSLDYSNPNATIELATIRTTSGEVTRKMVPKVRKELQFVLYFQFFKRQHEPFLLDGVVIFTGYNGKTVEEYKAIYDASKKS